MCLKSDAILLADVFETFRKIFLKTYHLDPSKFFSAPGLAWQAALQKIWKRNEKGIREGIYDAIHRYAKANNKYLKIELKIKNHHI